MTNGELSPALSTGVKGWDELGEAAIIFCLTSRIFSCKHNFVGKTSECFAWNVEVAWLVGNNPCSWNSIMTKCLLWSEIEKQTLIVRNLNKHLGIYKVLSKHNVFNDKVFKVNGI